MKIAVYRYQSAECHSAARLACQILSTHGDYEKARDVLQRGCKTKPWKLALRLAAVAGKLADDEGSIGLDKYVNFANWLNTNQTSNEAKNG